MQTAFYVTTTSTAKFLLKRKIKGKKLDDDFSIAQFEMDNKFYATWNFYMSYTEGHVAAAGKRSPIN